MTGPHRQRLRTLGTRAGHGLEVARAHPEVALLAALITATAAFGRDLSSVHLGGEAFPVVESTLLIVAILAIARLGLRGAAEAIRASVPLLALVVVIAAGVIAAVRGISSFGWEATTGDLPLLSLALVIPIVAVVVTDRRRFELAFGGLIVSSLVGLAAFLIAFAVEAADGSAPVSMSLAAAGLAISMFPTWVLARLAHGERVSPAAAIAAALALGAMALTGQRIVGLMAVLSFGLVVITAAPARRRITAITAITALALSAGAALGAEKAAESAGWAPKSARASANFDQLEGQASQGVGWRLAYWKHLAVTTLSANPLIGEGFGERAPFDYEGRKFDYRDVDEAGGINVSGAHNGFVSYLYRMGLPALAALVVLLAATAAGWLQAFRAAGSSTGRVQLVTVGALALSSLASTAFTDALLAPETALLVWVPLGLLLTAPRALAEPASERWRLHRSFRDRSLGGPFSALAGRIAAIRLSSRQSSALLALYGVVLAAICAASLASSVTPSESFQLLGVRIDLIEASAEVIEDGGPPMVIPDPSGGDGYTTANPDGTLSLIVSPLASAFDLDAAGAMRLLMIILFTLPLLYYPLVFRSATGSTAAALIAPLGYLIALEPVSWAVDVYWVQAWAPLALLPLVLALAMRSRFDRISIALVLAIGLGASLGSTLRPQTAAGVLLATVIVVLMRRDLTWPRRGAVAVAAVLASLVITPLVTSATAGHAEGWAEDHGGFTANPPPPGLIYHSAYIGLGYLPNADGIYYDDNVANVAVLRRDPDVVYLSAEYGKIIKDVFFDQVREDPGAVAELAAKKLVVTTGSQADPIKTVAFLFAGCLLVGVGFRRLLTAVLIAVPALAGGVLQGLVAIPSSYYLMGVDGTLAVLGLLLLGLLVARVAERIRDRGKEFETKHRRSRWLAAVLVPAVFVVTTSAASKEAGEYERQALEWSYASPLRPKIIEIYNQASTAAERDQHYTLGVKGPGKGLPTALELHSALGRINTGYAPFEPGSERSFEGWAYLESADADHTLLSSGEYANPVILRLDPGSDDVSFFPASLGVATWTDAWPGPGQWVHWVLNFDAESLEAELFINGKSEGITTMAAAYSGENGKLQIGAIGLQTNYPFAGRFAGIAVYERLLSAEQIAAHFEAVSGDYRNAVRKDDPALFWPLGEKTGYHVSDAGGNGNSGTINWFIP